MRLLRIIQQQWKVIGAKYYQAEKLGYLRYACADHGFGLDDGKYRFHWSKPSRYLVPMRYKTTDQMPEGYRIVEELIDLVQDKTSNDEEIRKKIDALQQARAEAKKEFAQTKPELAAMLKTSRQEAVFLIMGYID